MGSLCRQVARGRLKDTYLAGGVEVGGLGEWKYREQAVVFEKYLELHTLEAVAAVAVEVGVEDEDSGWGLRWRCGDLLPSTGPKAPGRPFGIGAENGLLDASATLRLGVLTSDPGPREVGAGVVIYLGGGQSRPTWAGCRHS